MSTAAAPAAGPAPAAPVAAPPSQPAGEPSPGAAVATVAKPIKPIPPPKLPGVTEDGPELATKREPDPRIAERARDASGRFVAGEPTQGKPVPKALEAPDGEPSAEPAPETLPDAKPKIKFDGRDFDTPEAALHYAKSIEGRIKPIQQKAQEFEGKARGWWAEAQRLAAENAELRAGRGVEAPAQSREQAAETPAEPAPEGINWELYAEIKRAADAEQKPWLADQWLHEQEDKILQARFDKWREGFEAPIREREAAEAEHAQLSQDAETLTASMAAHQNPDGTPAFPEFQSGDTAEAVGSLWQSLGGDPRVALTPFGAVAAVALYRMAKTMDLASAAPPAPVPAPAPPAPDPAAEAAAGLEGGRPLMPAAASRRDMEPGMARLMAGLKNNSLYNPKLGFAP